MSKIESALEIVPLEQFINMSGQQRSSFFSQSELDELSGGHLHTAAAFLAVKRALAKLLKKEMDLSQFVLSHGPDGEPLILSAPVKTEIKTLRISISHTRDFAYGLAVRQVK